MYVIDFKGLDLSMTLYTNAITWQDNVLLINTSHCANICRATYIDIRVKNHWGRLSQMLDSHIDHVQIKHDGIYLTLDDMLSYDVFSYINVMLTGKKYAWLNYHKQQKHTWLRACYYYNREHDDYCRNIEILGDCIQSKYDFLCAFAESLVGVGGYFGSDLDGFDDCFNLYRVDEVNLYWRNFDKSNFKEKSIIMQILHGNRVNVITNYL